MNIYGLNGRVAVVTGAAMGIGKAVAERLVASGAKVCLWDINEPAVRAVAATLASQGDVEALTIDAADPAAVDAAMRRTLERFGGIDIMVANAGVAGVIKNAWEVTNEDWDRLIRIDLSSVFYACRAAIPPMLKKRYGRIVIVSSIAGMEGAPTNSAYAAAKAGAIGYAKSIGKELAKTGIIVNCVSPSGIDTPLIANVTSEYMEKIVIAKMPIGRLGTPEECANLIAWLSSEECSFTTGAVFDLSGGRADY